MFTCFSVSNICCVKGYRNILHELNLFRFSLNFLNVATMNVCNISFPSTVGIAMMTSLSVFVTR